MLSSFRRKPLRGKNLPLWLCVCLRGLPIICDTIQIIPKKKRFQESVRGEISGSYRRVTVLLVQPELELWEASSYLQESRRGPSSACYYKHFFIIAGPYSQEQIITVYYVVGVEKDKVFRGLLSLSVQIVYYISRDFLFRKERVQANLFYSYLYNQGAYYFIKAFIEL